MRKRARARQVLRMMPLYLALLCISSGVVCFQASSKEQPASGKQVFLREGLVGDVVDGYWLYLPRSHATSQKWPIILFLQGGLGASNDPDTSRLAGPVRHIFEDSNDRLDAYVKDTFIIVNPHMRKGDYWERQWYQQYASLNGILDRVIQTYNGDSLRVYVTGLSRGGNGSWALPQILRDRVAAIVPICGRIHGVTDFASIKDLPIWVVHGTGDPIHDYSESLEAVGAIESLGGAAFQRLATTAPAGDSHLPHKHVFSTIKTDAHDVWTMTYSQPQLYRWLLQFESPQ